MRLRDKVSLIVGGTSGIGLATARIFSREGSKVVIVGRNPEKGEAAANQINKGDGSAIFVRADASRAEDAERIARLTIKEYGKLDVLFNNAGIVLIRKIVEMTEDEWDRMMAVNLKSVFLVSKFAIPLMEEQGGGSIINTSSIFGISGAQNYAAYCAAKAAVVLLTKTMALECVQKNIRVNCISPGSVRTDMLEWEMDFYSRQKGKPAEVILEEHARKTPMHRLAMPEEIASLVLYLASDESSFVTGSDFVIDGGRLASCDSPS